MFGYQFGIRSDNGTLMFFSLSTSTMGVHISYSGAALATLQSDIWLYHYSRGARCTRLDLTIDTDTALDLEKMRRLFDKGKCETNARQCHLRIGTTGATLYVGNQASDKFMRVYDKRAEQKQPDTAPVWYRAELVTKSDAARGAIGYLAQQGVHAIPEIVTGYCDWPSYTDWQTATQATDTVRIASVRKQTDTREWLVKIVAKTIAREVVNDDQFLAVLLAEIDYWREHPTDL